MAAADFRRIAGFSCRRQEICFAGLTSGGVRESNAYAGAAGGVCGGCARDFPAGWGKMGHTHIRLAAASEDVLTGALRTAWKLRIDKNAKTSRKKPHVAERSGVTDKKRGKRRL